MKILAFGAHPTDVIDLAGGTLSLHSENGDEVVMCVVSTGVYSHTKGITEVNDDIAEDIKLLKQNEVLKSANILGIQNIEFLNLTDEPLILNKEDIRLFTEMIWKHKPDVVLCHHPNEYAHWDHAEVGKAVCRALKSAIKYPSKDKHYVPNVYFYGVQFRPEMTRIGFNVVPPTILIDIKSVIEKKKEALFQLASQGLDDMKMLNHRVNSYESETGRADGLDYAEHFISYYPLKGKLLPENMNISFYTR